MNKLALGLGAMAFAMLPAFAAASEEAPALTVYKSEYCGCCEEWLAALEAAGLPVVAHNVEDLVAVKAEAGVPAELESCHTAYLDIGRQYVVEGHVPLEAIRKLIEERPAIHGISVPGMPSGSLGMGGPLEPHAVMSFTDDGAVHPMPYFMVTE